MNTPINTPMIVVNAKPAMVPIPLLPLANPTYASGNIAAINVPADAKIMNNAFLTFIWVLVLLCLVFSSSWCNTSSVMMIWSSTPVPTDAIKPAIAARSMFQWIMEATPKIIIISEIVVIKIGIAKNALLYLMYTTNAIPSIANNPAINAPCANC